MSGLAARRASATAGCGLDIVASISGSGGGRERAQAFELDFELSARALQLGEPAAFFGDELGGRAAHEAGVPELVDELAAIGLGARETFLETTDLRLRVDESGERHQHLHRSEQRGRGGWRARACGERRERG